MEDSGENAGGEIAMSKKSVDEIDSEREIEGMRKVEAALFISGRFLNLKELVGLTDINPILLRRILEDLQDYYQGRGIEIVKDEQGRWKMDVAKEHIEMVNRLATGSSEFTKAEQETLAIIAYKQPIKQSVVVRIRGNKAYDHIKQFAAMSLVNKKKVGRTNELTLNDDFYDYFHINKKDQAQDG